ncbi:hypothetical protein KJ608_02900, partial [Patescibacteria group bacterium]|nr:hypothetical protein [Patescibacteria group bacterium]
MSLKGDDSKEGKIRIPKPNKPTQTSISYRLIFKANERDCNIPNYHCQAIGWLLTKSGIRRNLLMVGGG